MTTENVIRQRVKINRMSAMGVSEWAKQINELIAEGYVLAVATDSNDRLDIHNFTSHPRYVVMTKPGVPSEVVVEEAVVEDEVPEESVDEQDVVEDEQQQDVVKEEENQQQEVSEEADKASKPGRKSKKA